MSHQPYQIFTLAIDGMDLCKIDSARSDLRPNHIVLCVTELFAGVQGGNAVEDAQQGKRFVEVTLRSYDILGKLMHQRTYLDCFVHENRVRDGARFFVFGYGKEKQ